MKGKTISVLAVLGFLCCPSLGDKDGVLYLHLPRTVCVKFQNLQLGSIAAVRGGEAKLVAKAMEVPMGRSPSSGEKIVIDRPTILSRLGTLGFDAKAVHLTGASEVTVMRDEVTIETGRLIKSAESFLQKARPGPKECRWRLVRRPKGLVVPAGEKISLKPALA
ncbi:hypothetical protein LCGC14_2219040, partial [marine sediment metagenome]